ncbi:MAG: RNA 2',3'-cyclic phosphodiesterase, partial [Rhodothermales bacterium]
PRVLVLHITPPRELLTLQKAVNHIATEIGFEPDPKPFNPHITLARLKDDARPSHVRSYLEKHHSFRLPPFAADRFHLYRSDTLPKGAQHMILQTYPLGT